MCVPCVIAILVGLLVGVILLFFRRCRILGIILLLAAVGATGFAIWQANRYERNFPLIATGDSQQRVRELLGRPASITDGTKSEYGYARSASEIRADVTTEFWYYCIYAPDVWAVSFDKDQKVVTKYELKSP